jgi:GAF domain-containing protein
MGAQMSEQRIDLGLASLQLSEALAETGQPQTIFEAFERVLQETIGHRLFTVLAWRSGSSDVERLYASRPVEYPPAGRKRMGPTPWGEHVLDKGLPWFGRDAEAIRWAFPDHELILSLGCQSCLNAPVRHDGQVLGVVNVLDGQDRYRQSDLDALVPLSAFLIPALLASR